MFDEECFFCVQIGVDDFPFRAVDLAASVCSWWWAGVDVHVRPCLLSCVSFVTWVWLVLC